MTTPGLTVRGVDRNDVVIDGEFQRPNGVSVLFADGVVVENMTAINNTSNGFFWSGVRGYRRSYLTAVNNAVYGIYALRLQRRPLRALLRLGSPDAGFYIGQCDPCQAIITDSISEWNGLGYSGTNASSDLYIVNSTFRHNVAGIAPNTLDSELLPPFHNVTVVGNLVHDNGNIDAPLSPSSGGARQRHSSRRGRQLVCGEEPGPQSPTERDRHLPHARRQLLHLLRPSSCGELRRGSGLADLTLGGPATSGNCFEDNEFSTTLPAALEIKQPCEGLRFPALFEIGSTTATRPSLREWAGSPTPGRHRLLPHPGPQPNMPEGARAPVMPAVDVFAGSEPDIDIIGIPAMPSDLEVTQQKGINVMGVSFASAAGCSSGSMPTSCPWSSTRPGWSWRCWTCRGGMT